MEPKMSHKPQTVSNSRPVQQRSSAAANQRARSKLQGPAPWWGLAVHRPAFAIFFADQRVGFAIANDFALFRIVLDLPARAIGDHAHEHGLDQVAAVFEVTGGFEVAFRRVNPLLLEIPNRRKK